jgi:hypothetical protein
LKSSEAGLVAKVNTSELHFGEGWEEVSRLTLLAVGDAGGKDRSTSTEWRDPETRNEAIRTQSTVLAYQQGIITQPEARLALGYQPLPEDAPGAVVGTLPPGGAPGAPATGGAAAAPALPATTPAGGLPA